MAFIMSQREGGDRADEALARLAGFRRELYFCFGMRRDVLFEVCDAVLCQQERVLMLAEVYIQVPQAGPRLDPPETPRPGRR